MKNHIKEVLANGGVSIGTWHTVCSIEVCEAIAELGFDWIAIDMEHGSADVAYAKQAFMAMERHGCAPFVRMPSADHYLARRLLDAGAHGLLVPVVEDPDAFTAFAKHCLYPPEGRRGVTLDRFNGWGGSFEEYLRDFRPVLVPMIETRRGVAAAEALARLPFVDGLFFGPYDLSTDLGTPGDFTTPDFRAALDAVKLACARAGKAAGGHQIAPDDEELRKRIEEGFRFVALSNDMLAMRSALGGVRKFKRT